MRGILVHLASSFVLALTTLAGQWPAWRGPQGTGIADEKNLPLHWSATENVRWCAPLPGRGNSTPVVWGSRVFITQAIEKENLRTVMCFDRHDGRLLWQRGVTWTEPEPTYPENPPCSSSPVVDGKRVVAWFGSAGVHCYDFDGREMWWRDLGRQSHDWGYASSPVLYRDLCLLNFGPGARSFVIALEKKNGRTVWQFDLPSMPADARWEDFGGDAKSSSLPGAAKISEVAGSWATPLVVRAAMRDELVVALPLRLLALAPQTGHRLWSCSGPNIGAYSSAFFGDGIVGLTASGLHNTALTVRPGGQGDVTATHRLWFHSLSNGKACVGSGVIFQRHIYLVTTSGFAQCLDVKTGQVIWEERLTGTGARNGSWSSPLLAEARLYVPNQNADVFVLRASPQFESLATNSIGGEPMNASLAVSERAFFVRTDKALWCIAKDQRPTSRALQTAPELPPK